MPELASNRRTFVPTPSNEQHPVSRQRVGIRACGPADAAAVALLSAELGYPTDHETMRSRIEAIVGRHDHGLFVACRAERIVGWIHVAVVQHVQSDRRAEIGGLVVAEAARSEGVGAQLLAAAEEWAAAHGLAAIVVRSQIKREAAHHFYEREGYTRIKTSAVFSKILIRDP